VKTRDSLAFLSGGGQCGELARTLDWGATPVGLVEAWPAALKTTVGILLHSRQPMFLWWGAELVQIYNDAYVPSFGVGKHPRAMGQRGSDCWQEIWPIIKPQIDDVMQRGKPSWNVDHLVPIWRNGRIEEVYWTYGYSPVYADDGSVGGTLVVCSETTKSVVAQRRLDIARTLALALLRIGNTSDVIAVVLEVLARAPRDVPFAMICAAGEAPRSVGLSAAAAAALDHWIAQGPERPALRVLDTAIDAGHWPEPVSDVLVLPLEPAIGRVMVFGLSSRLPFDDEYRSFLEQLAEQVVSTLSRARTQGERRSLLEQAPVPAALLTGPDHVFEIANPRFCKMVGRDVVGRSYADAFPELRTVKEIQDLLDRAYQHGEPYVANEMMIPLLGPDGELAERYFNFNLEPIRDADGVVFGMMSIALDMTPQVTARRVLEQTSAERARLLQDAQAASRAKDEFLAMLGHELRNPLAPIVTAIELMDLKGCAELKRERDIIEHQTRHLIHLVDDLLDVARVAQGKIELRRTRLPLSEVVARAIETVTPLLEEKAHVLEVDVPLDGLDIDADPTRFRQVVANLLTNAAKFTPQGGRVSIQGALDGDAVLLRVADNGIGIAPEQLGYLFDLFFQGPRNSDRAGGGLGLGLALVKTFVSLHGGSVRALSEGLNRGSSFEIRMPCAEAHSRPAAPRPATPAAPVARRAQRVLVVDDNTDLAELLSCVLRGAGLEVCTAHDGLTALGLVSEFRPSLAIIDIGLPVMDGFELAARLREQLGPSGLHLIAMTGYGQPEDRERTRRAGFSVHLVKPVDSASLLGAIDALHASAAPTQG